MLGKSLVSPLLSFDSVTRSNFSSPDLVIGSSNILLFNVSFSKLLPVTPNVVARVATSNSFPKKWAIQSTAQTKSLTLSDEEKEIWETCRQAFSTLGFSVEEEDKILAKAFGQIHSPYWGEERKKEIPKLEMVNAILDYLRSLGLSEEDLTKLLKKFPEVLGCSLEDELKTNVQLLGNQWAIKGKSLRNLLLRNPKVLGYTVDCKGDCIAQCTRCWVRF